MNQSLRSVGRASVLAGFALCLALPVRAADPVAPVHGKLVPTPAWSAQTVSSVVPQLNSAWGTNKYHIVEVLATGTMVGFENETVRGLGPGIPPALVPPDTELMMSDGQFMHVYVKSSGPLQHQPLAQWGTIVGTIAFVLCMAVRVFKKG